MIRTVRVSWNDRGILHGLLSMGLLGWAHGCVCHGVPAGAFAVATGVASVGYCLALASLWLWWLRWLGFPLGGTTPC